MYLSLDLNCKTMVELKDMVLLYKRFGTFLAILLWQDNAFWSSTAKFVLLGSL